MKQLFAGFHDQPLPQTNMGLAAVDVIAGHWENRFTYTFQNFFHPFVGKLINKFNRESLPGLMDPVWQAGLSRARSSTPLYHPHTDRSAAGESFRRKSTSSTDGAYGNYNWELFFHLPLVIAVHLSKARGSPRRSGGSTSSLIPPATTHRVFRRGGSGGFWPSGGTPTQSTTCWRS